HASALSRACPRCGGPRRAICAGIDSIEHGSLRDDEALRVMAQKGTFSVPTLMALEGVKEGMAGMDPRQERKARLAMDSIDQTVRKAVSLGVRIALFRMDETRASVDAELFGIGDRLGSIEVGKLADTVAVPGDSVADIRQ